MLIKILRQWKLFDSSGEHKIHTAFTPSMGGIAIFLGAAISLIMCLSFSEWVSLRFFFVAIGIMFIIGLRDDVLALTPKQKLYSQFLPVLILVLLDNTHLNSSYGIFGHVSFPDWTAYLISVVAILLLTNAYNLIDGLDGLAGIIGLIILTFFGIWFMGVGNAPLGYIAFCFSGPLVAFLFFNWQPSKIFMGDTGALLIGILISFMAIEFINTNFNLPDSHLYKFASSVSTAICVLIIPVFDTTRIIILRLSRSQSPFKSDKSHIHHAIMRLGMTHAQTAIILGSVNLLFLLMAWAFRKVGDAWMLPGVILLALILSIILDRLIIRKLSSKA